ESDEIADVHHADRVVERIVVDDESRVAGTFEHAHELAELDILLHRDDVRAGNHDVADASLAEAQDVLEHPAFFGRKAGFTWAHGIEDVLEVSAHAVRLPAEQRTQHPHEPALAFLGRRYRN